MDITIRNSLPYVKFLVADQMHKVARDMYQVEEAQEDEDEEWPAMEGQVPRIAPAPNPPTDREIALHNLTHIPPRRWCEACVAGITIDDKHPKAKSVIVRLPVTDNMQRL